MERNCFKSSFCKKGFTLVELLVVVLIIAILTAIAVPQYNKAVAKSRLAAVKPMLAAIKAAQEDYFLETGNYTSNINQLLIVSGCPKGIDNSLFYCDKHFTVDILSYNNRKEARMRAYYCPKFVGQANCLSGADFEYDIYYADTIYPDKMVCIGKTEFGRKVCAGE